MAPAASASATSEYLAALIVEVVVGWWKEGPDDLVFILQIIALRLDAVAADVLVISPQRSDTYIE